MYKTIKLNTATSRLIGEAYRRMYIPYSPKTVDDPFLGLGTPSEYRPAVEAGLMKPFGKENPRGLNWYCLTDIGKKILKQIIRKQGKVSCTNTPVIKNRTFKIKI